MWSVHQREEKEAFKIEGRAGEQESMERIQGKVAGPVELELVCIGIKRERKLENIWCRITVVLNATLGHMNVLTNRSHWRYLNREVSWLCVVGRSGGKAGQKPETGRLVRRLPQFTKKRVGGKGLKGVIAVKWERNRCKGKN